MRIVLTEQKVFIKRENIPLYALFVLMMARYLIPVYYIGKMNSFIAGTISYTSLLLMIGYVLINKFRISFASIVLLLIYSEFMLTTILNRGRVSSCAFSSVYIIALCLVINSAKDKPNDIEILLKVIRDITLFFFCINLVYGLVMPGGIPDFTISSLNPYFLYGNINASLRSIFPGLCCSCILDYKNKKKISSSTLIFFIGFLYFCFRIYFMATGFVGIILVFCWVVFSPVIKPHTRKVFIAIVIAVVLFEIFIVFVGGNTALSLSISNLFGKTGNFSGRGLLWSNCLNAIHQKLYIGFGLQEEDYIRYLVGNKAGSHNYYLDLTFQRGIIGLLLMILLLISPVFEKEENLMQEHYILIGFCGAYIIMFLAEPFVGTEVFHIPIFYSTFLMTIKSARRPVVRRHT